MFNRLKRKKSVVRLPRLSRSAPGGSAKNFFSPTFWATSDADAFRKIMQTATTHVAHGYHFADNLFTWARNNSMLEDEAFVSAWATNAKSDSDKAIIWRRYVLACVAYHCIQLTGDFVECGAYTGVGVKTVMDYLGGPTFPKVFWLYDLFEHDPGMLHHPMAEHGPDLFAKVQEKFSGYPRVRIVRGNIPEVLRESGPTSVAYLHIDLNEAPAEIGALNELFDKVVPGGIVILDDYEWSGPYRSQKIAEDEWFEARKYRVLPLPTGQGLVFKR